MSSTELVKVSIEQGLVSLRHAAEAIIVKDQQGYIVACQLALDVRAYIKDVKAKLGPGVDDAKRHVQKLQNDMAMYVTPAEAINQTVSRKAEEWKRAEREAAQREQERIQAEAAAKARQKAEEERGEAERIAREQREAREKELEAQRKAGEIGKREEARLAKQAAEDEANARALAAKQAVETAANVEQITVAPAVPKVAGIKARVNWKFRIVHPALIPLTYRVPDEVAIGQMVRATRDKAAAEKQCPGIEVYSEDGI